MIEALRQRLIGLALVTTPVAAIAQQTTDPMFGPRALNRARSALSDRWALRRVELTYKADGDALKVT